MSYLDRLTEYYQLFNRNTDTDLTLNGALESHLESKLPTDFCEAIFVLGMELRDEDDIDYSIVKRGIAIVRKVFETKKEVILKTDNRFVQYQLGLVGMYLNPCTIDRMTSEIANSSLLEDIVFNIRECLVLLDQIHGKATGVLSHQVQRQYEYVFKAIEAILVDNNNVPPDLDSIYVFADPSQFENDYIWHEIIKQLRAKYSSQDTVPVVDSMSLATQELEKLIHNIETTAQKELSQSLSDENTVSDTN